MTGVSGTHSTACGHLKASVKNLVTTVWARRWSAQLEEFGFPNGNSRIDQKRGHGPRRRARGRVGCRVRKEWDQGVETRGFLCIGRDPGAPKGAEWVPEEDSPELGWGLGAGEDEDSTMRE